MGYFWMIPRNWRIKALWVRKANFGTTIFSRFPFKDGFGEESYDIDDAVADACLPVRFLPFCFPVSLNAFMTIIIALRIIYDWRFHYTPQRIPYVFSFSPSLSLLFPLLGPFERVIIDDTVLFSLSGKCIYSFCPISQVCIVLVLHL